MKTFTGIPASEGAAIGKALVLAENPRRDVPRRAILAGEAPAEMERLRKAAEGAADELRALLADADRRLGAERADIFRAHLLMLEDGEFLAEIGAELRETLRNAEWVARDALERLRGKLLASPDPAFRERAADVADVADRLIERLLCARRDAAPFADLEEDAIVVARDLLPSDALLMDKSRVRGIALDEGGATSHTAILARALGIPVVAGLSGFSRTAPGGATIALDGTAGTVIVDPDERTIGLHEGRGKKAGRRAAGLAELRGLPAETRDGRRVSLLANIGFPEEAEGLDRHGAEGVGLYRSEFLFIAPGRAADEDAQFEAYSRVLKAMGPRPVTIRTMDAGGDKILPGLQASGEKNPLLGWRAIRLSLANPDLFKGQLRAMLRAGVHGNLRIMFPLICCVGEIERARELLDEARDECKRKKQAVAENVEVGAMIEVPSAAVCADVLAESSDFFSVGTNDLVQYGMAVDRGNERVHYLGDPFHPAVLRLLKMTIDAARAKGIRASVCGELAGDPLATAILLGLGLEEFSMNAPSIPRVKEIARGATVPSCEALAAEALAARSAERARAAAGEWMAANFPGRDGAGRPAD